MIVLIGKMASGKTTTAKLLVEEGFKRAVTDTTRKPRPGEVDHVDYNFISEIEFFSGISSGNYAEYTSYNAAFGKVYYGSRTSLFVDGGDRVIVLNPYGLKAIREKHIPCIVVYLRADKDTLHKRLTKRGDMEEEIVRRLQADDRDFADIEPLCDAIIDVDGLSETEIATAIINVARRAVKPG